MAMGSHSSRAAIIPDGEDIQRETGCEQGAGFGFGCKRDTGDGVRLSARHVAWGTP